MKKIEFIELREESEEEKDKRLFKTLRKVHIYGVMYGISIIIFFILIIIKYYLLSFFVLLLSFNFMPPTYYFYKRYNKLINLKNK